MLKEENFKKGFDSKLGDQIREYESDDDFDPDAAQQIKTESKIRFWIRMGVLGLLCFCGALIVIVYVVHLIAPQGWRWLSASELESIRTLTISIISSLLLSYAIQFFAKSSATKR